MRIGIDASRAFGGEPTGTERYSYEVITRLLELPEAGKQEWILYTRKSQFPGPKIQTNSNTRIVQIPHKYLWTQVGLAMRTWIDKLDVLWVPAHTLPVFRRPGLRTVVTIHGIEYEWLPAYENWLQRWYLPLSTKYVVSQADKLIAVSEFTKNQLVGRLGATPSKIEVVYEGVNESNGAGEWGSKQVWRKFGLQEKQYMMFVGTIQPRKNLVRLIEAFSRLRWGGKLVISGKWGWSYDEVMAAPRKFGVEERVIFTGYIKDTERLLLLRYALLYIQPSITEGFGLPVIEAMKLGVPVIVSSGGALLELVPHPRQVGGQAWPIFDPSNVEDMASKIEMVIGDTKLRLEMIQQGRRKANEFTWHNTALKTYNILTSWRN